MRATPLPSFWSFLRKLWARDSRDVIEWLRKCAHLIRTAENKELDQKAAAQVRSDAPHSVNLSDEAKKL